MNCAAADAKFLHCLPARRGEEVTSEVIDSPASAIVQQANNPASCSERIGSLVDDRGTKERLREK